MKLISLFCGTLLFTGSLAFGQSIEIPSLAEGAKLVVVNQQEVVSHMPKSKVTWWNNLYQDIVKLSLDGKQVGTIYCGINGHYFKLETSWFRVPGSGADPKFVFDSYDKCIATLNAISLATLDDTHNVGLLLTDANVAKVVYAEKGR